LSCVICKRPIETEFFRFRGNTACPSCAEQVRKADAINHPSSSDLLKATLAAAIVAVVVAFAWAMLVKATHAEFGIAAVAVGWAVVFAASKASGGKRGPAMGTIVILFSLLAIYFGKNLTLGWAMWDEYAAQANVPPDGLHVLRILLLVAGAIFTFKPFDLLWYGLVIYGGWRRTQRIPFVIEGPFNPAPTPPPQPVMQFSQAVYNESPDKQQ
jgi:hypothetical protein